MRIWWKAHFTNGQLRHTLPYLEANKARVLEFTQGKIWTWTGPGEETGAWWDGVEQFVQFDGPFLHWSWLYWKDIP